MPRQQVGVHDQHACLAILQDVAGLLGREVPVDRHRVGAEQAGRTRGFQGGDVVAQEQRHGVRGADAERLQAGGGTGGAHLHGFDGGGAVAAEDRAAHGAPSASMARAILRSRAERPPASCVVSVMLRRL